MKDQFASWLDNELLAPNSANAKYELPEVEDIGSERFIIPGLNKSLSGDSKRHL